MHELNKQKKYAIHCAGGYRAIIAYSFLKNNGYNVKAYPYSYAAIAEKTGLGVKSNTWCINFTVKHYSGVTNHQNYQCFYVYFDYDVLS